MNYLNTRPSLYMYDVVLFLLKLAMFVCAALVAVTSLELPVNNNTTNAMIASVQIILCSAVFFVYRMCAELLAAVREHRSYDAVFSVEASPDAVFSVGSDASSDTEDADAAGVAEKTQEEADTERERLRDASARAALGALNVGAEQSDEDTPVAFESIGVLREHIMLVHATGFLVWHSVLALDYSQPALAYSFTCGIVAAWLFQVCLLPRVPSCHLSASPPQLTVRTISAGRRGLRARAVPGAAAAVPRVAARRDLSDVRRDARGGEHARRGDIARDRVERGLWLRVALLLRAQQHGSVPAPGHDPALGAGLAHDVSAAVREPALGVDAALRPAAAHAAVDVHGTAGGEGMSRLLAPACAVLRSLRLTRPPHAGHVHSPPLSLHPDRPHHGHRHRALSRQLLAIPDAVSARPRVPDRVRAHRVGAALDARIRAVLARRAPPRRAARFGAARGARAVSSGAARSATMQ